jgi:immune inhibitor A
LRRLVRAGVAAFASVLLAAGLPAAPAPAAPKPAPTPEAEFDPATAYRDDNLPNPLAEARAALRRQAVAALAAGRAKTAKRHGSEVLKVADGRYVEYRSVRQAEKVLAVLVEFGDKSEPATGGGFGPVHNKILAPDRSTDNTTAWRPDFNRDHYQRLLFGPGEDSLRGFYRAQSGGRHTIEGDVADWVKLPYNGARYGKNSQTEAAAYGPLLRDTAQGWYNAQLAAGKTPAQIKQYLSGFDRWDRYDHDNDGDFNEADGYLDHFVAVHAGPGEESGGGPDAIASHHWHADLSEVGRTGPAFNKLGGAPLGDSGLWVGDYVTGPENGTLGLFAHLYGHDLGLADAHDTEGGDSGVGYWSLMAAGPWLSRDGSDLGSAPAYLDPYAKLLLGWLDYRRVKPRGGTTHAVLGPAGDGAGGKAQAVLVNLPDQQITTEWNTPASGRFEWWGGSADGLDAILARQLDLTGAGTAALTAKAQYEMEEDFDFLHAEVSTNGGSDWTALPTAGVDAGETGLDGSTDGKWVDLRYDLSGYTGKNVLFRFRYATDGGVHFGGPFLDDIALIRDGGPAWTDDVETKSPAWTATGWRRFTGAETTTVPHFYLAENRSYFGHDDALRTGPYNFGSAATRPHQVERFGYGEGLLVWYVNLAYEDNNVSQHPGFGLNLPVDARPGPVEVPGRGRIPNRGTAFDAAFGRLRTAPVTLHLHGTPVTVPAADGIPMFDDTNPEAYWTQANEQNSVKVAGSGTKIEVLVETHGYADLMLLRITN